MPVQVPKDKVIITVAQTGAITTKALNPGVPEQPDEIIQSAKDCYNAGAAVIHIHARDPQGGNSADVEIFKSIHRGIREAGVPVILQDSTGGGPELTQEERIACLYARPEMASLNMGTMMRTSGKYKGVPWSNMPDEIVWYAEKMKELGVKPEMEIYNHAMIQEVKALIKTGLLKPPYHVDLVLGMKYQGAEPGDVKTFMSIMNMLPDECSFNCAGIGGAQLPLAILSMLNNGNVRCGLEDNVFFSKGVLAVSNAQIVERIVRIARDLGKEPMTPEEARAFLGLESLETRKAKEAEWFAPAK